MNVTYAKGFVFKCFNMLLQLRVAAPFFFNADKKSRVLEILGMTRIYIQETLNMRYVSAQQYKQDI